MSASLTDFMTSVLFCIAPATFIIEAWVESCRDMLLKHALVMYICAREWQWAYQARQKQEAAPDLNYRRFGSLRIWLRQRASTKGRFSSAGPGGGLTFSMACRD